jgi:mxaA protein
MRLASVIASLLLSVSPAAAAIEAVHVYEPRNFGYFIGDTLERDVEVITSGRTELFTAGLPRPGPLTYWLDLTAISFSERDQGGRRIYDVKLQYQIFYSAIEATNVEIPTLPLKFKNPDSVAPDDAVRDGTAEAEQKYTASLPALKLVISPLRNIILDDLMPEKTKELSDIMRPDVPAQEIATAPKERRLIASSSALLASMLLLAWHYAVWPFSRRDGRPFTQASRQIRDLLSFGPSEHSYADALLILHRAFDETAGHRLFGEDAEVFVRKHRRYAGIAPRLAAFFESSRLYFFSEDRGSAERAFSLEKVQKLAEDLARKERASA